MKSWVKLALIIALTTMVGCGEPRREAAFHQQIRSEIVYFANEQIPYTGILFSQYSNGHMKSECFYKDGKKDGAWKEWDENDQLMSEAFWKDGREDGIWRQWYDNGKPWTEEAYKNGRRDGTYKKWDVDGRLMIEETWKDGNKLPSP